jgi:hypothetical protein
MISFFPPCRKPFLARSTLDIASASRLLNWERTFFFIDYMFPCISTTYHKMQAWLLPISIKKLLILQRFKCCGVRRRSACQTNFCMYPAHVSRTHSCTLLSIITRNCLRRIASHNVSNSFPTHSPRCPVKENNPDHVTDQSHLEAERDQRKTLPSSL